MDQRDIYGWLMQGTSAEGCHGFDGHVVASTLSLACMEANGEGASLLGNMGLDRDTLTTVVAQLFPHAAAVFERLVPRTATPEPIHSDEVLLRDLLVRCSTEGTEIERVLAFIVARRCLRNHHLWQDLGLRNRRELSWLMERHFSSLASRNTHDMKWKKFLYRVICRDEGHTLCPAPSCSECSDYEACFGDRADACGGEGLSEDGLLDDIVGQTTNQDMGSSHGVGRR